LLIYLCGLDSNPILESFGNAKTIRNNNSSRFGKYMEVNFDKKNSIKGCNITAYLLEKSRVVKQGPNERNYHVFYMFLSGASKDMRKEFALKPVDQYHYLTQSGCVEIPNRSDYDDFEEMMFAMNNLKIEITTQKEIFQCLAAILHLGNLSFVDARDVEGGSRVLVPADARKIASLLTVSEELLERSLCNKDTMINGEPFLIPLNPDKALDQRDSLSKYLYGKIFDYIIHCVNSSLYRGKPGLSIGVLDIFGFEVFQLNSFEQLCINYCNERLQTFFNEIIFEGEMKMYSAEGLPVEDITYQDNLGCVRLVDMRGAGVFAYLGNYTIVYLCFTCSFLFSLLRLSR
jgi:myosin heavy subunit